MRGKGIPSKTGLMTNSNSWYMTLLSLKGNRYTGVYLNHHQMNVWRLFAEGFGGSMYNSDAKMIELSKGKAVEDFLKCSCFLRMDTPKVLGLIPKAPTGQTVPCPLHLHFNHKEMEDIYYQMKVQVKSCNKITR